MQDKNLKTIWISAIISALLALSCLIITQQGFLQSLRGNKIFQSDEQKINKIQILSLDSSITLQLDENLWRVMEADNYYADPRKIQKLQKAILEARQGQIASIEPSNWATVKIYGEHDHPLGEVNLAQDNKSDISYVRFPHQKEVYQTNWRIPLDESPYFWTLQPLLTLQGTEINKFEKNQTVISRNAEGAVFYNPDTNLPYRRFEYMRIFDILSDLRYEKVLSSQEFDTSRYAYHQAMALTTFDGLFAILDIYTDYKEYWIQLELRTTRLPRKQMVEEVKNKQFLYQDWWFKLKTEDGQRLWMFNL